MVTHWLDSHGKEYMRKLFLKKDGRESLDGSAYTFLHRKLQLFLSACVDDIKMAGKTQTVPKMWPIFCRRKSIWTTQCHSLIKYILDVPNGQHKSITELS